MPASALDDILHHLRREPSRTWSLVITIYGDAIVPRGGSVWLGTLTRFVEALGIGEGALRTAMSRLAADGWLERSRSGRNSFYHLTPKGQATFATATEHIYDPPHLPWTGHLQLLLLPVTERESARATLQGAGFGSPSPGLWIAPGGTPIPPDASSALRFDASGDDVTCARAAAAAWPLGETADAYRQFVSIFGPLATRLTAGDTLSDIDSFVARVLLIHAYRRVVLRDPILPAPLLPADWPGPEARQLCGTLYRAVLDASERWLDLHGVAEAGALPGPGPELRRRFC